ncbi:MAG TPA: hypothetical protein VHP14_26615 [Anaerolineales bacterium]|nr:hypothetical protein [Anaerolineales bacterium]
MGASDWSYFIPYQQDLNKALQQLKEDLFQKGQYERPIGFAPNEIERNLEFLASIYKSLPNEAREHTDQFLEVVRDVRKKHQSKQIANSINDLLNNVEKMVPIPFSTLKMFHLVRDWV